MKPGFSNKFLGAITVVSTAVMLAHFVTPTAQAAALTWSGGNGIWLSGSAGGWSAAWNNVTPDSGTFNGAGGIVDVQGPIIAAGGTAPLTGGLTFAGSGNYTLSASSAQIVTVGTTTNSLVSIASGRTAIIGNNVTLQRPGTAGGWYLSGGGILEIATGGAFSNSSTSGNEIANGTTLRINGGTATLGGSLSVGVLTGPGAGPGGTLIVDTGSLTIGGTGNLAIGRVNGETTVGTLNGGSITVSGGNLNFGTGSTTSNSTFNLNGGTLTVKAVTSTNATNSTFSFNGGTLKAAASAASTFMTNVDTARIRNGAAIIDSNGQAITIAQVLAHSALGGDNTIDGGLTLNDSNGTPGSLILTGSNTYNGATKITSGILSLGNSLALQNSSLDTLNSVTGTTASGLKTTVTTLTFGGLTGNKNLADVFTTAAGGYSGVTDLTLNSGSGVTHSYSGAIANGAMTLAKTGAGAQTLSGSNGYDGITTITTGALIAAANNALGTNVAGTTVSSGASLGLSGGIDYTTTETVSGSGAGSAVISGTILVLGRGFIQSVSGNNTFRGNIIVNAGGVSRIGTQDGTSLTLTGSITQASGSMLFRPGDTAGDYVSLSNSGNSFGGDSKIYSNVAAGNYAGVRLGVDNALPTTLTILGEASTGAGTALNLNGFNQELNGLAGSTNLNIINTNTSTTSTLRLDNLQDRSTTGTLVRGGAGLGTINVIKEGSFTQTLSGTHDYSGTTAVNVGKLVVNGNISTSSLTSVASGATLGGTGTTGALTIASGGFVTPGNSPGILTVSGNYTQAGLYTAEINGLTPGSLAGNHDQISVTGSVDITDGSLSALFTTFTPVNGDMVFILLNDLSDAITGTYATYAQGAVVSTYGGFDWKISYLADSGSNSFTGGNDIALMAVPEPRAALLGALGLLALLRRRR